MLGAIASFWHEMVFWWAVAMTLIVCYDHADRVRGLAEWISDKIKGIG